MTTLIDYKHVDYLWDDEVASKLDPVERLVYRSNLLGQDQRITNTGGGNTSSQITEVDPITAEEVEVLWVKGSGGDLRTSTKENFSSLYQDKLISLQGVYADMPNRGLKTEAEDKMVGMYRHTTYNLNPRASSIDTPLHSFIPYKHVDHMHPNAIIAVAAAAEGEALTKEIYGDEIIWTEWQRPGFELGLELQRIAEENPNAKGIMLGQHGIINWANDDKECYDLTIDLIEKAAEYIESRDKGELTFGGAKYQSLDEAARKDVFAKVLPWLRGQVSQEQRFIGTVQSDDSILRFVNSVDAPLLAELGTSCPDHFLRTKIKPLYVDWDPASGDTDALLTALEAGLEKYKADYAEYYERCKRPDSPAMRNAIPTIVLIPGLGMVAWGKNKSESRVTAEFYNCAVEVMRGAEAIGKYRALPEQEAFDIEYWALEEAKLQRMPKEKSLARQVVAVVGAGSGIGKELCHRIVPEGAHLVCIDLKADAAEATSQEIVDKMGEGIGVAGTGISGCGPSVGLSANITDRESVANCFKEATLAYGGLDAVVVTAGIFVPPSTDGQITDDQFTLTFDINVKGGYIVSQEAAKQFFNPQQLPANFVITTSANAVVSKKGSVAYDCSKAAANHLIRELAIELSPKVRVNGVAPATVVKGSAMFPRDRVIASLAKYDIPYSEEESAKDLRDKLAEFYAKRTLTQSPITPADQAEAIYILLTDQLSKTTGQVIAVDGGLHEAFLR
ncbi:MAG: bifunctional rhamnulose-1-phosphate aldolase/short-chain dehydrogenase [Verrucomicrobiota bacterium]